MESTKEGRSLERKVWQVLTRRWVGFAALIAFALALIALAGIGYLFTSTVEPQLKANIAIQERHKKLYFEDFEFLGRFEILKGAKSGRSDAGPKLNPKVHWIPHLPGTPKGPELAVSVDTREKLLRFRSEWIHQHKKMTKTKVDLSLFDGIEAFDYWDIESASPLEELIKQKKFVPPTSLPQPDSADLIALAKLKLMRAADENDPLPALKAVRQLARLLLTTESQQLVVAGIAILDVERQAFRFFVDEQNLKPELWEPVDRNVTRRAYRAFQGTRGYLRLWTNAETFEKIFLGPSVPPGFCAAANESFPIDFSLRPLLEPHWPMERNYKAGYARLDKAMERAREVCRVRYLKTLVEDENFEADLPGPRLFLALPYARHLFGMKISVVNFSGFEAYNAAEAKTN